MTQFENATDWLDSFRAGDKDAYAGISKRFHSQLVAYSYRMIHNEAQAQQIADESLSRLFKRSHIYSSTENIEGFLMVATRNASLIYLRSLKSFQVNYQDYVSQNRGRLGFPPDKLDLPALERLFQFLQQLPEKSRRLVNYWYVQQMPYQKVAELMETTVDNIHHLRDYTLRRIKDELSRSFDPAIVAPFFAFLGNS